MSEIYPTSKSRRRKGDRHMNISCSLFKACKHKFHAESGRSGSEIQKEILAGGSLSSVTLTIMANSENSLTIRVEFGGGLELLFSNQRSHKVNIPATISKDSAGKPTDVDYLIHHLRDNLLKEREELFMEKDTVYVCIFCVLDRSLVFL